MVDDSLIDRTEAKICQCTDNRTEWAKKYTKDKIYIYKHSSKERQKMEWPG